MHEHDSSWTSFLKIGLLIVLGFLWSGRLAAIKAAGLSGVPVHVVVPVSVLGIAAAFTLLSAVRRAWPPLRRDTMVFYGLTGTFGFVLPFILESLSSPNLPLFVLLVIISTMPIVTVIAAALLKIERPRPAQYAAIALGFGVALLIAWDTTQSAAMVGTNWLWVMIAFCIPVFYAGNSLFVASRWPKGVDALQVACAQGLLLSVAVLIGSVAAGTLPEWSLATRNMPAMLGIVFFETLALLVYLKITRDYGATFMSLGNYIAMVFAAILGHFLFDDPLTWLSLAAAGLLVASLSLNHLGRRS
ncbi:DMT family transporter [Ahrensia marina]|uniref:DMT family transporter n=1 Tax=Ahrensia marina TaxID=1514904 RepID=UPI0035CF36E4